MAQLVIVDRDILIDFGLDEDNAVKAMAILESNYQLSNQCNYGDGTLLWV